MPHGILRLGEALLRGPPRPQVRFRVGLLQHALRAGQIPPGQRQLAVGLPLHCGAAVPCDRLSRVDGAAHDAKLVGVAEAELGGGVA